MATVSVEFDDRFAPVSRITDEPLRKRIDDRIERVQQDATDPRGPVIGDFHGFARAISPVDGQTNRAEDANVGRSVGGGGTSDFDEFQTECIDRRAGERKTQSIDIDRSIRDIDGAAIGAVFDAGRCGDASRCGLPKMDGDELASINIS